jgi:hypothetical protein
MEVPLDLLDDYGLVGTIKSWEWAPGRGWLPSSPQSSLPPLCGFGHRTSLTVMAKRISQLVIGDRMRWPDLRAKVPEIDFLIPQDMDVIRKKLRDLYQLDIVEDRDGTLREIGKIS